NDEEVEVVEEDTNIDDQMILLNEVVVEVVEVEGSNKDDDDKRIFYHKDRNKDSEDLVCSRVSHAKTFAYDIRDTLDLDRNEINDVMVERENKEYEYAEKLE